MNYTTLTIEAAKNEHAKLIKEYGELKAKGLKLDMSRGKPGKAQLDITMDMMSAISPDTDCLSENGFDCRNYGLLDGIPEAKRLFAELLGLKESRILVAGNSSLNLMYDSVARAMLYGVIGSEKPWSKYDSIKFLCPVPGYDRHFAICQSLGIEMINIPMTESGPDMDLVEKLVLEDESIKGIWCVPKFSNPGGIVYSDETVKRFGALKTAAKDFRIFWDNAYAVHDLDIDFPEKLLDIFTEAEKHGNLDKIFYFASTSKISFPGSGVAIMAASEDNLAQIKKVLTVQTIGFDKLNMLRHTRYFKDANGVFDKMREHAAILKPKFEIVLDTLKRELGESGIASWTEPKGGYFISLDVYNGCAKRVYQLMCELGVTLTPAGATFPYGKDPDDKNIRIAPTFPPNDELKSASEILCLCVKLAALEKIYNI
ncbi:MAG: aminotransferase class I/II-fold pyridoxal phosphate-dependent enzyme [Clostridia bacterium]|nr:aminotransferase class I/II-fold pyridoxal phosphate-dependent enzyme [Clostridia bacterium]